MTFKKIAAFIFLCGAVLTLAGCSERSTKQDSQPASANLAAGAIPAGRFLFSAKGCPHCETVAAYVQEHDIRRQMYYIEQTVNGNSSSDQILTAIAARCGIPSAELSVPLFWDGASCYMGSDAVISYFASNTKP